MLLVFINWQYTPCAIKTCHLIFVHNFDQHMTDFLNSFTVKLSSKFVTRLVSYFPPHLQHVATLLCEKHNIRSGKILVYLTQYHHFHWKRNHWVDRTRLTISRVIGRWISPWPWNVGQRSLKVIEISAIRKLGCSFLFAFCSNYGRICSRLWDIQCQRMVWP